MKEPRKKPQTADEIFQNPIIIDSTVEKTAIPQKEIVRICWNTGDEKHCPGCYLRRGCKARD